GRPGRPLPKARSMKILAPLRDAQEVSALLEAGADEFFCGVTPADRGERRSAGVSGLAEFEKIVALSENRPVYVALNAPYCPPGGAELLAEFGARLLDTGAAGLIVADMDLLLTLVEAGHASRIHVSSLATCSNAGTAEFFRDLGVARIILPRHLTLSEIEAIIIPGVE